MIALYGVTIKHAAKVRARTRLARQPVKILKDTRGCDFSFVRKR